MLNESILMGRLTANPEVRYTQSGTPVATFCLAVERDFNGPNGEREADFVDIVAWRKTAEFVRDYFKKGQMMAVKGGIQTRTYTDKDGKKRKAVEVVADRVYFAEGKRTNDGPAAADDDYQAPLQSDMTAIADEDWPF